MIPKKNRLKGEKTFALVAKTGRRLSCGPVTFVYKRIAPNEPTKIGIVVSTKVSNKATVRNKIKRKLRVVLFRIFKEKLFPPSGMFMMVLTKSTVAEKSVDELTNMLTLCLQNVRFG